MSGHRLSKCWRLAVAGMGALALGGALAAVAEAPNRVQNPSFETVTADGTPPPWTLAGCSSVSADSGRTGKHCLLYERSDGADYRLTTAPVLLTPGRAYEISAWVRTESVTQGQAGAATICLEWSRAGTYYGGEYPKGIAGTQRDWTQIRAIAKVPADAAAQARIVCYLRKTATGKAWFDDVAVREFSDFPLVEALRVCRYRDQTAGGAVRIAVQLGLTWSQVPVAEAIVELAVRDGRDQVVQTLAPSRLTAAEAEFSLDSTPLAVGGYTLVCTAQDRAGTRRDTVSGRLERVESFAQRLAYVDTHRRLIVKGEPFFPLGTYWNRHFDRKGEPAESKAAKNGRWAKSMNREHLDLYARSPFNCLMPYDSWDVSREDLDYAYGKGIRVIFSVKDTYFGPGGACHAGYGIASQADERRAIAAEVGRVGDHPGVIAWYINDEIHPDHIERLRLHQQWLQELDPGRPTWSVSYHDWEGYWGSFDVFGGDPYPIPNGAIRSVFDVTRRVVASVSGGRAVWMVPQIMNHAAYAGPKPELRAPTVAEMRAMAWMSIAGGANGLIFYSFFDLVRMDGVDPFEMRWADVMTMAAEVRAMVPVLLSVDPLPEGVHAQTPGDAVVWRLFVHGGRTYLVTVNTQREPATASFSGLAAFAAVDTVLGESPARLNGAALELDYAPIETKIVCLRPAL